jgi:hypothetical protein
MSRALYFSAPPARPQEGSPIPGWTGIGEPFSEFTPNRAALLKEMPGEREQ